MEPIEDDDTILVEDVDVERVCRSVDSILADQAPGAEFSFASSTPRRPHHHHYQSNNLAYFDPGSGGDVTERMVCKVWMLTMSLLIFLSLVLTSGLGRQHIIAMAPMETRALHFPAIMTDSLRIERMPFSPEDAGNFSLYHFYGSCPPLTGPIVKKSALENVTLSTQGDFVYRSLYLNRGSVITVDVTELGGKAAVYLVDGELSFDEFRDFPQDYRFTASAIAVRKESTDGVATNRLFMKYEVPSSDTFFLLYVNPKKKKAVSITSRIDVEMTTHLLDVDRGSTNTMQKENHGCFNTSMCWIKTRWQKQCAIVRAEEGTSLFENDLNKFPILSIDIEVFRRWGTIFGISIIPLIFLLLYSDNTGGLTRSKHGEGKGNRLKRRGKRCSHPSELTPLCTPLPARGDMSCTTAISYGGDEEEPVTLPADSTKRVKWKHPVRTIMIDPPLHRVSSAPRSA